MYAQFKFIEEFNAEFDFEETLVDHHYHPDSGTGSNHNNDDDMDLNADEAQVKFKDGSTPAMYMVNARNNHLMNRIWPRCTRVRITVSSICKSIRAICTGLP